jgi:hypothetical protein
VKKFIVIGLIISTAFIGVSILVMHNKKIEKDIINYPNEEVESIEINNSTNNIKKEISETIIDDNVGNDIIPPTNNDKKQTEEQPKKPTTNNTPTINQNEKSNNETKPSEIPTEQPQVDQELEKAKARVEYKAFEDCQTKGFEISFSDSKLLGFSCPYIAYKGQILGYRLQLDYTNPMNN